MVESKSPARPARRQRRSEQTQARLLDAALEAFVARGYDQLALTEVTERADLGTGTLYVHFRDKRSLYQAVVRRALAGVHQRWLRSLSDEDSPTERVLGMVRVTLEFLAAHPAEARLFLLDGPSVETWLVDEVARAMATFMEGSQRELRASLVIGVALAAARHHLLHRREPGARQLLETTLEFCAGGLAGADPGTRGAPRRRARRGA